MQKIPGILIVFLLVCMFGNAQTQDPPSGEDQKLRITERQYDDISDKDRWEIKAVFPSVWLEGDKEAEDFNGRAKSLVMKEVNRFKNDLKEMSADANETERSIAYSLSIGYSAEHFDETFVSIRFDISEFTGGAHPNHWSQTLNYDLQKKKKIDLADLFKPGSDYLGVISRESSRAVMDQIKEMTSGDGGIDAAWVKEGTAPLAKNFKNWNISKSGLKFSFDPYQVGPYVLGGFETTVPYRRFPFEMQADAFYAAESVSFVRGDPPNVCRGGLWTSREGDFLLATVEGKKNTKVHFYGDEGNCPDGENCRRKAYLIPGDDVIVQRKFEGFSCVWFQPSTGAETVGWIKSDKIELKPDTWRLSPRWTGKWSYTTGDIEIKETQGGKVHVYGTAFWKGMGDNIHVGEIDYLGIPQNRVLDIGDGEHQYDCRVKLRMIGQYLIVSDNQHCGGVNVSFNGVYVKKQ